MDKMKQNVGAHTKTIEQAVADYLRAEDGFNDYMRRKFFPITEWDIFYKAIGPLVGIKIEWHSDDKFRYRRRTVRGTPGVWISSEDALRILDDVLERKKVGDYSFRIPELVPALPSAEVRKGQPTTIDVHFL